MSLFIGKNSTTTSLIATPADENMIKYVILKYFAPKIGLIKLVARKDKHAIPGLERDANGAWKLKSSDPTEFVGWVYLDGDKYNAASFPKAPLALGVPTSSSGWFVVPTFNEFFSTTSIMLRYETIDLTNGVIPHVHATNSNATSKSGKIINALSAYVVDNWGSTGLMTDYRDSSSQVNASASNMGVILTGSYVTYVPTFHNGCGGRASDPTFATDLNVDVGLNFSTIMVTEYGSSTDDIWPDCKSVGAMVYIGVYEG